MGTGPMASASPWIRTQAICLADRTTAAITEKLPGISYLSFVSSLAKRSAGTTRTEVLGIVSSPELARVALLDGSVHVLAIVLEDHREIFLDADGFFVGRLRRHAEIIPLTREPPYNSVDLVSDSALAFKMN